MKQAVQIYRFAELILICPVHTTTAGLSVAGEPFTILSPASTATELGLAVHASLALSGQLIAHPKDWKAYSEGRLKAAGVKSQLGFQRGARLVTICSSPDGLIVEPSHNGGTRGDSKGFYPLAHSVVSSSIGHPEVLGSSIEKAFVECT